MYELPDPGSLRTLVRRTHWYVFFFLDALIKRLHTQTTRLHSNPGFSIVTQSLKDLYLLEDAERIAINSWGALPPTAPLNQGQFTHTVSTSVRTQGLEDRHALCDPLGSNHVSR